MGESRVMQGLNNLLFTILCFKFKMFTILIELHGFMLSFKSQASRSIPRAAIMIGGRSLQQQHLKPKYRCTSFCIQVILYLIHSSLQVHYEAVWGQGSIVWSFVVVESWALFLWVLLAVCVLPSSFSRCVRHVPILYNPSTILFKSCSEDFLDVYEVVICQADFPFCFLLLALGQEGIATINVQLLQYS